MRRQEDNGTDTETGKVNEDSVCLRVSNINREKKNLLQQRKETKHITISISLVSFDLKSALSRLIHNID